MAARRKLAAILFADIAGFTHQVYNDEESGLANRKTVDQTIKACAISRNGRVVKSIGDGEMLEFASAVEAVGCALDIQQQIQTRKAYSELDPGIYVRIGIHAGDIVKEEGDLYGNAVNIAQRIQEMAAPGGICISRDVLSQISPILKLRCEPVTSSPLKPLPEPLEVFQVTAEKPIPVTLPLPAASPLPKRRKFIAPLALSALALGAMAFFVSTVFRIRFGPPRIDITQIPPPRSRADQSVEGIISGTVTRVDPRACRVLVYQLSDTWYLARQAIDPWTEVDAKGQWSEKVYVNPAYAALLVKPSYHPLSPIPKLPLIGGDVFAVSKAAGYPSVFINQMPAVRKDGLAGPGSLAFTVDSDTSDYSALVYVQTDEWYLQKLEPDILAAERPKRDRIRRVGRGKAYAVLLVRPSWHAPDELRELPPPNGDVLAVTVKNVR